MLYQYLHSHRNKDEASGELRLGLVTASEPLSYPHSDCRERSRRQSYEQYRLPDIDLQKSERHADSQSVDACGNRQREHGLGRKVRAIFTFILGERLLDHVGADDSKQYECYPMVHIGHEIRETDAEEIADQGHKRLEATEPEGGGGRVLRLQRSH